MIIVPESKGSVALNETLKVEVQKVCDGDGFLAKVWNPMRRVWVERISFRLAFIDAPEMEQRFGRESRDFLSALIVDRPLELAPVMKGSADPKFIDYYRRILCVPYLTQQLEAGTVEYYWNGRCATGKVPNARLVTRNIELEMVVNGWAWVLKQYQFDEEAVYLAAQSDAQRHRRGLWSDENPEPPWRFKRRQNHLREKLGEQDRLI